MLFIRKKVCSNNLFSWGCLLLHYILTQENFDCYKFWGFYQPNFQQQVSYRLISGSFPAWVGLRWTVNFKKSSMLLRSSYVLKHVRDCNVMKMFSCITFSTQKFLSEIREIACELESFLSSYKKKSVQLYVCENRAYYNNMILVALLYQRKVLHVAAPTALSLHPIRICVWTKLCM